MVTTVSLRGPFEYYWWVLAVAGVFLIVAVVLFILAHMKYMAGRPKKLQNPSKLIRRPLPVNLMMIKDNYSKRLQELGDAYSNKRVGRREAYQRLSALIRGFVSEATGIDVLHYTREEIKAFGIKSLDGLMKEYYVPEFAEDEKIKDRNFSISCRNALEVIRKWN